MSKPSDDIRKAIENCGLSRYRISQMTGVDQSVLYRFCTEGRSMSTDTLDKLSDAIGIKIVSTKTAKSKSKRK